MLTNVTSVRFDIQVNKTNKPNCIVMLCNVLLCNVMYIRKIEKKDRKRNKKVRKER